MSDDKNQTHFHCPTKDCHFGHNYWVEIGKTTTTQICPICRIDLVRVWDPYYVGFLTLEEFVALKVKPQ
jgi:hypothetical protein